MRYTYLRLNTKPLLTTLAHLGRKEWLGYRGKVELGASQPDLVTVAHQEKMTLALLGGFSPKKVPAPYADLLPLWQKNGETLARNLKALKQVSEAAAKEDLQIIPLKGALFSLLNLPHALQRIAGDVDVIVPAHQLDSALRLFRSLHYVPEQHHSPRRFHSEVLNRWMPFQASVLGRDPLHGPEATIDLHWDPVYLISGARVGFDLALLWNESTEALTDFRSLRLPPPAFVTAHVLVHTVHHSEEAGLKLMTLFDLAICIDKIRASFDDCLSSIQMKSKGIAVPKLREYWQAAQALKTGDIEPFFQLRSRETHAKPLAKPWISTFGHIGSTKDRAKFLLGYVLPKNKKRRA